MADHIEKSTSTSCFPNGIRKSYNVKFKQIIINYVKKVNNGNAARKYMNVKVNIQGWSNNGGS
jgi:hypothetical protein